MVRSPYKSLTRLAKVVDLTFLLVGNLGSLSMSYNHTTKEISNMLKENRSFAPQADFSSGAHVKSLEDYKKIWRESVEKPSEFWSEQAKKLLNWDSPWDSVYHEDEGMRVSWFKGAKINASANCLDRHVASCPDKTAIFWEGEPGDTRSISYAELHRGVCKLANGLKRLGMTQNDVLTIYMPMIPELTMTVLACARLGIMHNVVFAGFSSEALATRILDAGSKYLVTADGVFRKGKKLALKSTVDKSLEQCPFVKKVIVYPRTQQDVSMQVGRDIWWSDFFESEKDSCPALGFDSENPLFLLYTSGSTGKPKGIVHSTGGYLLGAAITTKYIFDLQDHDVYWCTADAGWITGHTYSIYGPLSLGVSTLMYEGAPNTPDWGRFWALIEKYKVSKFYTAPTAIRSFIKCGPDFPDKYDLSSLRLLGTVGESINPEVWMWFRKKIGGDRCPIVDTWWQTETGSIMISGLPGVHASKPGAAMAPFFGVKAKILTEEGEKPATNTGGYLTIANPWPSMMRTIFGDHERFINQYWSKFPNCYFTGDGARCDEDGDFWIMGRIDDVLNVSGHRLSTMEIESALVSHDAVSEAAVVGQADELTGEAIFCFVALKNSKLENNHLMQELKDHVSQQIGSLARPRHIQFTESLPKTRSGKIMRRLLRDLASGKELVGDVSTLEDKKTIENLYISKHS